MASSADVFRRGREDGFSLIEVALVLMFMCALAGIALIQTEEMFVGIRANEAMQQTISQLRHGRQVAMAQRRSVQLLFLGSNQIRLIRNDPNNATAILSTVTLPKNYQFMKFAEIGPDTPDTLGGEAAVYFGTATTYTFRANGMLVNQNLDPINGTVSIGQPGHSECARAVTIVGSTGRIRGYRWNGSAWID